MSMINQLMRAVSTAVDKNLTPIQISMCPEDARELVLQVRQADPERKATLTVPINNWPHVWNPRDKDFSPLLPKEWTYDDIEKGIKLRVPISIDKDVKRGGFNMTTKKEAPPRTKRVDPKKLLAQRQIEKSQLLSKEAPLE